MNPLLTPSEHPFNALPFDQIKTEHYLPAVEAAIEQAKQNLATIKAQPEIANFANTVEAIEYCGPLMSKVANCFFMLTHGHGCKEMHQLAKTISPLFSAFDNDLYLDAALFVRVKAVYDQKESLTLSAEQLTLLEKLYKAFTRNGALLTETEKTSLREIDAELATTQAQFGENTLAATNDFQLVIEDKADLEGLPQSTIDAAAKTAKEKDQAGKWIFTLHFPSLLPFLKYADNRALRETMYTHSCQRASGDAWCNHGNIKRIATLRLQRAQLLGYNSYAHYELENRMAATPEIVHDFEEKLRVQAIPAAHNELAALKEFKQSFAGSDEFLAWDLSYYSEKLRQQKYDFDSEQLRPYFELSNSLQGAFEHASKLFDLSFTVRHDIPLYQDDVQVFEVTNNKTGEYLGLLYLDFFPRDTKAAGAWCGRFQDQGIVDGEQQRPHVSIVCNFTPPTDNKPALLDLNELRTLFHEFGHALHGLLSTCTYPSLSCTNVKRDFVELPSQILENWILEPQALALFAKHYETGEALPVELIEKVNAADKFNAGLNLLRQVGFGKIDLAWHGEDLSAIDDVIQFERDATADCDVIAAVEDSSFSSAFGHIFQGGYAAGYYSYLWAEVLDADAYELFKEKGIFDREVAQAFRENILEKGGSEDPMKLYEDFRGRKPDPQALLKRKGLI
ncbi:MAG: M3 family metallopeptidase [Alteromonadales bacterium]|nr:M3 family metallopeptidase [Alteromonadales bacterium]